MAIAGNPYGFFQDRTKYPLTNLNNLLLPAPHTHMLADITDYAPAIPPEEQVPSDDSSWELLDSYTPDPEHPEVIAYKTLALKRAKAIPVKADETYKFQLNEGYYGTILYKADGTSSWEDQYPDGFPEQYPVYWECPGQGSVIFKIRRIDGSPIDITQLAQTGIIFIPFSASQLEIDFRKEMTVEQMYFTQNLKIPNGASPSDPDYVATPDDGWTYRATFYRRGHMCSVFLVLYCQTFPAAATRLLIIRNEDWKECNPDGSIIADGLSGIPQRFLPISVVNDQYVNSDQWINKVIWLNWFGSGGASFSVNYPYVGNNGSVISGDYTTKAGDMLLWTKSGDIIRGGRRCIASFTYPCFGE